MYTGANAQTQQESGSTTAAEGQGPGRKHGHSDPDGVDSEPGNNTCSYQLLPIAI